MKNTKDTVVELKNAVSAEPNEEVDTRSVSPTESRTIAGGSARTADRRIFERGALLLVGIVLYVVFTILSPHTFFSAATFQVIVGGQTTVLLLAVAATVTLRCGDFDLSISAQMVLAGCLVGILFGKYHWPVGAAIVAALLVGLVVGTVNAFFVVIVGVDSLIVTLGMISLLTGLGNVISGSNLVASMPHALTTLSRTKFLSLPTAVWIAWGAALIVWYVYEYTPIGKYMAFIGGSRPAAALAGINVSRVRFGSYIAAGLLSSLAGILLAGTLGAMDPGSSGAFLLAPFSAAFLGATAIQPGRFNIMGTLVGLYVLAIGIQGLNLIGVQGWISDVFYGGALLVAVSFARYTSIIGGRRKSRPVNRREATG